METKVSNMNTMHITQPAARAKRIAVALVFGLGALAMVGCPEKGNNSPTPAAPAASTSTAPAAPASTPAPAPSGSNDNATPAAPSAAAKSQATIAGTLELFIEALEEGDFVAASTYVDSSTDLHSELLKMADNIETGSAHNDPQRGNIGEWLRLAFAVTFAGADYEINSEEGSRARATLTLPNANNRQHQISLNQVQGEWFIVAGRELLRQAAPGSTPTPAPPAR